MEIEGKNRTSIIQKWRKDLDSTCTVQAEFGTITSGHPVWSLQLGDSWVYDFVASQAHLDASNNVFHQI